MDIVKELAIALVAILLGGGIVAAFRARQLYFIIPNMLGHGGLTGRGQIVQFQMFNRARQMEEDVRITVPETLRCELVAADSPEVKLANNEVLISRLPPMSNVTAILLVEGPVQSDLGSAAMTSKTSKGRLRKSLQDVPPNFGAVITAGVVACLIFALAIIVPTRISDYLEAREKARYEYLAKAGWDQFQPYIDSPSRNSYADREFPASLIEATSDKGVLTLKFVLANKTALPLKVDAFFTVERQLGAEATVTVAETEKNAFGVKVDPLNSSTLEVSLKGLRADVTPEKLYVQFSFEFSPDDRFFVAFYPSRNPIANAALTALLGHPVHPHS